MSALSRSREADAAAVFQRAAGLLLDLDGTLIDSTAPVRRAWTAFAQRHGLDPDEVLGFAHGRPSRETVRLLAPEADHQVEAELLEAAEVGDTDGIRALPGAERILTSGRPLAIVTSCSRALARARLGAAGLPTPELLVTASDITHGKPDPECFLLGAERLGVAPQECVVLEDAPAGIAAGRAAGATVIALVTTHAASELEDADWAVDGLDALLA